MIFITREQITLLESKFHFQIEDWNLPMVDSFEITNVDWVVTYKNQKFTREIQLLAAVGFNRFDITGNFSQFSGTFLVHLQQTCFWEIILYGFIATDCFFTFKSICDKYFVGRTQIKSDRSGRQQSATCTWTFASCQ